MGYAVHEGCMRAAQKYEDSPEAEKSMQRRSVSDHTWIYAVDLGLICGVEYQHAFEALLCQDVLI